MFCFAVFNYFWLSLSVIITFTNFNHFFRQIINQNVIIMFVRLLILNRKTFSADFYYASVSTTGCEDWPCCMVEWKPQISDRLSVGFWLAVGLVKIPSDGCSKLWLAFVFFSVGVVVGYCSVPPCNSVIRGCTDSNLTFSGTSPKVLILGFP